MEAFIKSNIFCLLLLSDRFGYISYINPSTFQDSTLSVLLLGNSFVFELLKANTLTIFLYPNASIKTPTKNSFLLINRKTITCININKNTTGNPSDNKVKTALYSGLTNGVRHAKINDMVIHTAIVCKQYFKIIKGLKDAMIKV